MPPFHERPSTPGVVMLIVGGLAIIGGVVLHEIERRITATCDLLTPED